MSGWNQRRLLASPALELKQSVFASLIQPCDGPHRQSDQNAKRDIICNGHGMAVPIRQPSVGPQRQRGNPLRREFVPRAAPSFCKVASPRLQLFSVFSQPRAEPAELFIVHDANGQQIAYIMRVSPARRSAAKLLTRDEAR